MQEHCGSCVWVQHFNPFKCIGRIYLIFSPQWSCSWCEIVSFTPSVMDLSCIWSKTDQCLWRILCQWSLRWGKTGCFMYAGMSCRRQCTVWELWTALQWVNWFNYWWLSYEYHFDHIPCFELKILDNFILSLWMRLIWNAGGIIPNLHGTRVKKGAFSMEPMLWCYPS